MKFSDIVGLKVFIKVNTRPIISVITYPVSVLQIQPKSTLR